MMSDVRDDRLPARLEPRTISAVASARSRPN